MIAMKLVNPGEVFARLNAELNVGAPSDMPKRCLEPGGVV